MFILSLLAAVTVSAASWNGKPVAEQSCRVSAIPFNRVWPGYQRSKDQTKSARFVSFDVERPGVFAWTLPAGAKSARIRPFRRNQGVVRNGALEVAISRPEQFVIESGGEELHVFADAPWHYEPRPGDRYFGPGEHDAGAIIPKSGERIILDRGAVVYGNIVMTGVTNVTIEGRGILDGSRILREDPNWPGTRHLANCGIPGIWEVWGTAPIYANRCRGISLSGIVFRDAPRWTMNIVDCRDIVIDGVKLVGMWRYNSDGIDICASENAVIRNSFIRSFDDCVISRPQIGAHEQTEMRNMTVSNCVLWCDWGCNMKVQHAQRAALMSNIRFRNIDCVNVDATAIVVTTRWGSSDSRIHDVTFDDIRIDAPDGQFRQEHQRTDDHVFSRKVKDSVTLANVSAYSLGKPAANQGKPGKMDPNFFKFDYRNLAFRDFFVYDRPGHLLDDSSTITPKLALQTQVPRHTISNVILSGLPATTKIVQRGNVTNVIRRAPEVRTFTIDATKATGGPLANTAQMFTLWHLKRDSFANPAEDPELDPYKFVEFVEVMGSTGGHPTRDCFRNPTNCVVTGDYDFSRVVAGCRNIRARGMRPYLKLGNVPEKLSAECNGGDFQMNIRPPTDYAAYGRYMAACARALVTAFGREEVLRWRFSVLTEYENGGWFKDASGDAEKTFQAYCRLYEVTAKAFVREVGPEVAIGAHAMAVSEGLWDERRFLRYAAEHKLPLKFVSASFYDRKPGEAAKPFDLPQTIAHLRQAAEAAGLTNIFYGVDEGRLLFGRTRNKKHDPLVLRIVGDTYQAAYDARVVKQLYDCGAEYFSAWGYFSGPPNKYSSGLPSVSFYVARDAAAFKGMRRVGVVNGGTVRPGVEADAVAAISDDGNTVRVMAYAYTNELFATGMTHASFKIRFPKDWAGREITMERRRIDDDCNWFDAWRTARKALGITDKYFGWSPDCPTSLSAVQWRLSKQVKATLEKEVMPSLRACSKLKTTTERRRLGADAVLNYTDALPANAVLVLVFGK